MFERYLFMPSELCSVITVIEGIKESRYNRYQDFQKNGAKKLQKLEIRLKYHSGVPQLQTDLGRSTK